MKMKSIMASCVIGAGIIGAPLHATAVELANVSSGSLVLGEWNTNFANARSYAEANGIPLFAFWSNPGCGQCNRLKTACNTGTFVAWRKSKKIVMVFSEGGTALKDFTRNTSGKYPYCRIYWPAGDVDKKFSGRASTIPGVGNTLEAKLINCLDTYLAKWSGGGDPSPSEPRVDPVTPKPTPGTEWNRARKLYGTMYTKSDTLAGTVLIYAGKISRGSSKLKVSVTDIYGKTKSSSQKSFTCDATTEGSIAGKFGTYKFSITKNQISGSITSGNSTYEVKPFAAGGTLSDGELYFSLLDYPEECQGNPVIFDDTDSGYLPNDQAFTSKNSRWTFPRKGTLKYNRAMGEFVMSNTGNPSGLRLSYKSSTGFFKGSFIIYTARTETNIKQYKATVTGFMVGNEGAGVAVVKNVGEFACAITSECETCAERMR